MVSRCQSSIGKKPAITTCDTFHSIPTDENGAIAKVEPSTPNPTSCGPCTSGVTRSSRMRSRCDSSENRACLPPRANASRFLPTGDMPGSPRRVLCHEYCPVHRAVRNCTRDEGGPFEVGNQVLTSSHRKLLSSKAMVVNVAETPGQDSGRQG